MNRSVRESLDTAREYARAGLEAEAAIHYRFAAGLLILARLRSFARLIANRATR